MDPYRIRATAERLKRLPDGRRRRLRVVRGHLFYGIHEFPPQGATYITMLREPVARVLSACYFILRRPLHPLHRKLKRERLGVEDCLRLFPHRQNLQCRLIAGVEDTATGDERLLDISKENLTKSFSVVGICERFEESLVLTAKTFGCEVRFMRIKSFEESLDSRYGRTKISRPHKGSIIVLMMNFISSRSRRSKKTCAKRKMQVEKA